MFRKQFTNVEWLDGTLERVIGGHQTLAVPPGGAVVDSSGLVESFSVADDSGVAARYYLVGDIEQRGLQEALFRGLLVSLGQMAFAHVEQRIAPRLAPSNWSEAYVASQRHASHMERVMEQFDKRFRRNGYLELLGNTDRGFTIPAFRGTVTLDASKVTLRRL